MWANSQRNSRPEKGRQESNSFLGEFLDPSSQAQIPFNATKCGFLNWLGPSQWVCAKLPLIPNTIQNVSRHLEPPVPSFRAYASPPRFLLRRSPRPMAPKRAAASIMHPVFRDSMAKDFLFLAGISLPHKIQAQSSHHSISAPAAMASGGNAPAGPVPPGRDASAKTQRQWSVQGVSAKTALAWPRP